MKTNRLLSGLATGLLCLLLGPRLPALGEAPALLHEVLYEFESGPRRITEGLVNGGDGFLYGVSRQADGDSGAAFRISPEGNVKVLVDFGYTAQGGSPSGTLCLAPDGHFYGVTENGGTSGWGTVFRLTKQGEVTTIHDFDYSDGRYPAGGLVVGPDQALYGVCAEGGGEGSGTVFRITLEGVFTMLYDFDWSEAVFPEGALVVGPDDGLLYGTARSGGIHGGGCVFRISPATGALEYLVQFNGQDGVFPASQPRGGLLVGSDKHFYGCVSSGGAAGAQQVGAVFKLTKEGALTWLADFSNPAALGANPEGRLLEKEGQFYLTTRTSKNTGLGTLYRMSPSGTLTLLHEFTGTGGDKPGANPTAGLALGPDGKLYGPTSAGGTLNVGTVFRVDPEAPFAFESITGFTRPARSPVGVPLQMADGSWLGVSTDGGDFDQGTVFRFTASGELQTLVHFSGSNGRDPLCGVTLHPPTGDVYGTTWVGGANDAGTLFRVKADGTHEVLYSGTALADGRGYFGGKLLWVESDGAFYGTSYYGGTENLGTVYRLTPDGTVTTVAEFNQNTGFGAYGGVILGNDGHLYGMTYTGGAGGGGTVYRAGRTGGIVVLKSLAYASTGAYAHSELELGDDGHFYGATYEGGPAGRGVLFRIKSDGEFTPLHAFGGGNGAGFLYGGPILAPDGNLYGLTYTGGVYGRGTMYRWNLGSGYSEVFSFSGTSGSHPGANSFWGGRFAIGSDNHLYGFTAGGGRFYQGTLFRVRSPDQDLMVKDEDGAELTDGQEVDFGPVLMGKNSERRITLRNAGGLPLGGFNFSLSGPGAGDFSLENVPDEPLTGQEEVEMVVRFTPGAIAPRTAVLHLVTDDPDEADMVLNLFGDGAGDPAKVYRHPKSVLAVAGEAVVFSAVAAGNPAPVLVWKKNARAIRNANGPVLTLPAVKTTDAAMYTMEARNAGGASTSNGAALGVLAPMPGELQVAAGKNLSLICQAFIPAGVEVGFAWTRNGHPVGGNQSVHTLIGATVSDHQGLYACEVTMRPADGDLRRTVGTTQVWVVGQPRVTTGSLTTVMVSQEVNVTLSASEHPLDWIVKGLPPGVALERATGKLIGRPSAARILNGSVAPYYVSITAVNAAGKSPTVVLPWRVEPLPFEMVGKYTGLIDRHDDLLNQKLGGRLDLSLSSSGAVSGKVQMAGGSFSFKAIVRPPYAGSPGFTVPIPAGAHGSQSLVVQLLNPTTSPQFTGSFGTGAYQTEIDGFVVPWASGRTAVNHQGTYNARVRPGNAALNGEVSAAPHGDGYVVLRVAASGAVRWSGKLAEGSAFAGSATAGAYYGYLKVPIAQFLYKNTGALHGWTEIAANGGSVNGWLDWFKQPQPAGSTRSYAGGFEMTGPDLVRVQGGLYVKPPTPLQPMLLPAMVDQPDNVKLEFTSGGLPALVSRVFRVTPTQQVILPSQSANDFISFKVSAASGQFSGKMVREDDDPTDTTIPPRKLRREVPYEGLIVPNAGGVGLFNLPQLPDDLASPPTTMQTSPLFSGRVSLQITTPNPE